MRASTMMQAQWKADVKTGGFLHFEGCKGGYFSKQEPFSLRVSGAGVAAGTGIRCCGKNLFDISDVAKVCIDSGSVSNNFAFRDGEVFTINMSPYGNGYIGLIQKNPLWLTPGDYTVSADVFLPSNGRGSDSCILGLAEFYGMDQPVLYKTNTSLFSTIGVPSRDMWHRLSAVITTTKAMQVCLTVNCGGNNVTGFMSVGMQVKNIQLEAASSPADYAPYAAWSQAAVPCSLSSGDTWFPDTGRVLRAGGTEEGYPPQSLYGEPGTVNLVQTPKGEAAVLEAAMLVRR